MLLPNAHKANLTYMQVSEMAYNISISMQNGMGVVQKHSSLFAQLMLK